MPQIVFQFMHPILEKKIQTSTPLWYGARRVTASLVTSDNEAIQPNEKASDFQQYEFGLVFHVKPYRTSKNFVFLCDNLQFAFDNRLLSKFWSITFKVRMNN